MEVLVLRHGQSVADIEERFEGQADFELTELGRQQARAAAAWIAERCRPDVIYSSPLKRAAETAGTVAERLGLPVEIDDDLKERCSGVLQGMLRKEAMEEYPPPEAGYLPHDTVRGGETLIDLQARATAFWSRLINAHPRDARLAVVSHGQLISALFRCFLDLKGLGGTELVTFDTGIHLWSVSAGQREEVFCNSLVHLTIDGS